MRALRGAAAIDEMRRAARVDANQRQIVEGLRKIGASVWITSAIGDGGPDLVVGFHGRNWLFEIKDGSKSPSRRDLTRGERDFAESWRGQWAVITSFDEALDALREKLR